MMKLFKILFFNSLLLGTLISISAHSWLIAWMGLEINLLSFIPLLKSNKNKFSSESTIKYFLTQTLGSSMLLFSISTFLSTKILLMNIYTPSEMILLMSPLLLKMGAAPFHFWFPEVMSGLNWGNSLILLTWQKLAPMILLTYLIQTHTSFISIIIITSSMISGILGLNQICLRKIMAYSSIGHMSWMISSILTSLSTFMYYFLIYSLINLSIILMLNKFNILYLNQLTYIFNMNKNIKFLFMMNFLSLGGLPPFLGFLPKWLVINDLIENNHYFITTLLIIFTLMTLYYYLRLTFSSFTIKAQKSFIILFKKMNLLHLMMNTISLMGLIFCSMMNSLL